MSLFDLSGKTAFVTGASRGIGRVIASALAEAGAEAAVEWADRGHAPDRPDRGGQTIHP